MRTVVEGNTIITAIKKYKWSIFCVENPGEICNIFPLKCPNDNPCQHAKSPMKSGFSYVRIRKKSSESALIRTCFGTFADTSRYCQKSLSAELCQFRKTGVHYAIRREAISEGGNGLFDIAPHRVLCQLCPHHHLVWCPTMRACPVRSKYYICITF